MTEIHIDENNFEGKVIAMEADDVPNIDIHCHNGHYLTTVKMHPFMKIQLIVVECLKCGNVRKGSNLWMEYIGKKKID